MMGNCIIGHYGGWTSSDYGYISLTLKPDGSKKLEFPAVGYRNQSSGTLSDEGMYGHYWTSVTSSSSEAYNLYFNSGGWDMTGNDMLNGYSVRCVKGEVIPDIDPTKTVVIGRTDWMQVNLANPKQASGGATFAAKLPSQISGVRAESHGKFYQWGINVAWNTIAFSAEDPTPNGEWNTVTNHSTWATPCPDGYRLPTNTEFQNLIDNCTRTDGGGWSSSDYGYITLTLKTDSSKKLEFPAVGYRYSGNNGILYGAGYTGNYWLYDGRTSTFNEVPQLYFDKNELSVRNGGSKYDAFNVRCVKNVVIVDDEVEMVNGIKWTKHNLANPRQASGGATFATKLPSECTGIREESHGKFYQWGINEAWSTTGSLSSTQGGSWMTTMPENWDTHPCPIGYRLPTKDEMQDLIDNCIIEYDGGWRSTDYGYAIFKLKTNISKQLEFPAVGCRNSVQNGTLFGKGIEAWYWSSDVNDSRYVDALFMYDAGDMTYIEQIKKTDGGNVRCVRQ